MSTSQRKFETMQNGEVIMVNNTRIILRTPECFIVFSVISKTELRNKQDLYIIMQNHGVMNVTEAEELLLASWMSNKLYPDHNTKFLDLLPVGLAYDLDVGTFEFAGMLTKLNNPMITWIATSGPLDTKVSRKIWNTEPYYVKSKYQGMECFVVLTPDHEISCIRMSEEFAQKRCEELKKEYNKNGTTLILENVIEEQKSALVNCERLAFMKVKNNVFAKLPICNSK